ncbi:DUF3899 domain-containing protein [Mycoplasmopsis bovigenitalium]|nr:DUF3899 domain-containing protein [Mycoplasmopsis bovigenitalium]
MKNRKWLHLITVLVSLIVSSIYFTVSYYQKKYDGNVYKILSDSFFICGVICLAYGVFILSFKLGLGSGLISISQRNRENRLKRRIQKLELGQSNQESRAEIKILNNELQNINNKSIARNNAQSNKLVFLIIIAIAVVLIIIGIIFAFV